MITDKEFDAILTLFVIVITKAIDSSFLRCGSNDYEINVTYNLSMETA